MRNLYFCKYRSVCLSYKLGIKGRIGLGVRDGILIIVLSYRLLAITLHYETLSCFLSVYGSIRCHAS